MQQQSGFANTRVAANQNHAAGHQASTQHAIKLGHAAGKTRHVLRVNLLERLHGRSGSERGETVVTRFFGRGFDERIPRLTARALPRPFGRDAAAFAAHILIFCRFCHDLNSKNNYIDYNNTRTMPRSFILTMSDFFTICPWMTFKNSALLYNARIIFA